MIDTLERFRAKSAQSSILHRLGFKKNGALKPYALLTLHRPSNVDERTTLQDILEAVKTLSQGIPVIFPVHPRTSNCLLPQELGAGLRPDGVRQETGHIVCIEPLGYLDFLCLMANARMVLTDSGGHSGGNHSPPGALPDAS